ncbi:Hint domain-containing protein [Wenxinia saemankumensis]|nr:Hint domain-containing protein [Wenxinia saemankumensis]
MMRRVEVLSLAPNGDIDDQRRLVPALPAFEDAFAAFARGTLFATERGQVAVEDLLPGDRVKTVDHGFLPLLWKGSTLIVSGAKGQSPEMGRLTRIAADALGVARPLPDLVLGPRARLIHRAPGVRTLTGSERALIYASDFIDGANVVALSPASPVQAFHLGFEGHVRLSVHGIECESHHPGPAHLLGLRHEMLSLYLSCFPQVDELADFGEAMMPRLRRSDLDLFDVA